MGKVVIIQDRIVCQSKSSPVPSTGRHSGLEQPPVPQFRYPLLGPADQAVVPVSGETKIETHQISLFVRLRRGGCGGGLTTMAAPSLFSLLSVLLHIHMCVCACVPVCLCACVSLCVYILYVHTHVHCLCQPISSLVSSLHYVQYAQLCGSTCYRNVFVEMCLCGRVIKQHSTADRVLFCCQLRE